MGSINKTKKLGFHQKIQIGFISALVFLTLIGGVAWWSANQNEKTFRRVTHTYQVVDELQGIQTGLLIIESSSRGFAISGNQKYLMAITEGLVAVQKSLAAARQFTADNPRQQQRLAALELLIQKKIGGANEAINLRRQGDTVGALTLIVTGAGRQTMEDIRDLINAMQKDEEFLLHQRTEKSQKQSQFTMTVVGLGSLTAIFLVALAGYQVRQDYFKQQKIEAALRESEFRYRTLFESIDEGFCIIEVIFDLSGHAVDYRFLQINPAFEKQTGLRGAEGKRMRELAPKHEAHWFEIYGRIAVTGEPARFENQAEQLHRWYDVYAFRIGDPKNRQVAILFNDITGRRQMEEALRRSEENLAVTLHSIGDAVLTTDTQGNVTRMNPIAEKLTGWPQAEALGHPINEVFNIINETTRQPAEVPVAKVIATGEIHGLANHTIIIARSGTEYPIADSAAPIRDKQGQILGVVLVFRDVTDEKRAERAIAESEHQLRDLNNELARLVEERSQALLATGRLAEAALDALSAHVAVLDDDGTIIATNQSWRELAGHNELSLIQSGNGVNYLDLCQQAAGQLANDAKKMADALRAIIAGERKNFTMEYTCHTLTEKRWFLCRVTRFPSPGPARLVVAHENITQMKLIERQQIRHQRMESLGTLAGGVAHDLNNALAPILIGVQLLKEKFPNESEILDMLYSSGKRGTDMVRQLLTFARGAEGERNAIQLAHLIKELQKIIRSTFPKNLEVKVQLPDDLPTVLGDATQLHQVLLNLAVNARDAMTAGGLLTIAARTRELDAAAASAVADAKPGKYVTVSVRDSGTGIPQKIIDRIFDPFFTTKGPDQGTGLGLSTAMGIVRSHGGFIQVYSQPGEGSTFTVFLPTYETITDPTQIIKPATPFSGNGETILFVDDESALRDIARIILTRMNFVPIIAIDGRDALAQFTRSPEKVHAIITDLHMPNMDGLTYVRHVRQLRPEIPVVISSGCMDDKERAAFMSLGVTNYLDKPFTEPQLAEVLKKILGPKP